MSKPPYVDVPEPKPNYRILFAPFKASEESPLPTGLELFPVGTIVNDLTGQFDGISLPCDGRSFEPERYPDLTRVMVAYAYGTDENGLPRVPDLRGRVSDE